MTTLQFETRNVVWKEIWIEPACVSIELNCETEYLLKAKEDGFTFILDDPNRIIIYLDYSFGFTLYKRNASAEPRNPNPWEIEADLSQY